MVLADDGYEALDGNNGNVEQNGPPNDEANDEANDDANDDHANPPGNDDNDIEVNDVIGKMIVLLLKLIMIKLFIIMKYHLGHPTLVVKAHYLVVMVTSIIIATVIHLLEVLDLVMVMKLKTMVICSQFSVSTYNCSYIYV